MIYVPILRARTEEIRVAKRLNYCFNKSVIPMFEIISDIYEKKYKQDPITHETIYEIKTGNIQRTKVKALKVDEDIITLKTINECIAGKTAFIDYFRFASGHYGNRFDPKMVELSIKLNSDYNLYEKKVQEIAQYKNLIPVISIKMGVSNRSNDLKRLIDKLQAVSTSIAIRITDDLLDPYSGLIKEKLRHTDYLLFDIGEQHVSSKFMELEEIKNYGIVSKTILLNSPRIAKRINGEYETYGITKFIDNSARREYKKYGFLGFGDYGGLKDVLPNSGASNGKGSALALMFIDEKNSFLSYMIPDTSLGMRGYIQIKKKVLEASGQLDPNNDCPAMKKLREMDGAGSWATWNNITLSRYIHQIYTAIAES